ncbi:multidrug transporter subunit MdtD [Mycetohabitans sp. B5]|uniref:EmrB/QacA subfamily drug resistance transporter n=1 Tax=Mycetohabitans endofungorum TaxID=417203 RepID=A0A2P5KBG6_9BURK|nr:MULTISPECIES: multidrug transporter subunit MdtD [Mycetohabitans]MCG1055154.1 multidrug transporter subunit MdtD [Mycetohabitans sp. B5]PPB84037.1 EmrB/QacA subfamily drug resistance transporter [Mycetohabitans endofungorum]
MQKQGVLSGLLWVVGIGFFMQTLDATILNTALPTMASSFNKNPLHMQSIVLAYSLTVVMLIPASGWLADRFGTRSVFLVAIALFTIGSIGCATSRSLNELVIARVVQGLGGGVLLPAGRLAIMRTFPPSQYVQALGFVAIPGLVGAVLGPTLGGWIVSVASWRWIFVMNVPIGIAILMASRVVMDNIKLPVQRFDLKGYLLFVTCVLAISLSLNGLTDYNLSNTIVLTLLGASLVTFAAYGLHAARTDYPLFSLSLFNVRTYRVGLVGNLVARIGGDAMPYLIPLLLQIGLGYSPYEAGMMMLPVAAAAMGAKRFIAPLVTRYGYRRILASNSLLVGAIIASFSLVSTEQPAGLRMIQLLAFGALYSIQTTAMNALTLKDLVGPGASSGNALFSTAQMLAMSLSVTVASVLLIFFQSLFTTEMGTDSLPIFRATFICIGLITAGSVWVFGQLAPDAICRDRQCRTTGKRGEENVTI